MNCGSSAPFQTFENQSRLRRQSLLAPVTV